MHTWVRKALFSGSSCQHIVYVTLIGWAIIAAISGKMPLTSSTGFNQGAAPFQEHYYKIEASSCGDVGLEVGISLPGVLDGTLSFLADWVIPGAVSPDPGQVTAGMLSTLTMIGASQASGMVHQEVQSSTPSRSALFHPIINRAATQYQVDPALVRAIIFAESGNNPEAVSSRGAMGLMQLMPGTAKAMGVEDCFDPEHNIFGGVKYFKKLINQFGGDVKLALAAYNAGSRKVREFNGVPPFRATKLYIQKVLKYYDIYKGQQPEPVGLG